MGHWWVLGSVLYPYLYWGIILIIGLIFGPAIFVNTYAELDLFILYIFCFILVGRILNKTGLKRP
jgi:predicted branched-subunit amino acid permease